MAIWDIEKSNGNYVGYSNSGETAGEAISNFLAQWPCYSHLTNELRAVRMRSVYMGGGWCKIREEAA
jgi:hypothetical protein